MAHDVVVIGAGAAGLSAALVLGRARRRVAVVDTGEPRNAPAAHMQGFLSRDGMPPAELLAAGRAEAAGCGVEFVPARVDRVDPGFTVRLSGGAALRARRVLVATGLRDELPALPGVAERWGRDVLHCPYCHGYEVRDQPLGVLGGRPGAAEQALLLRQWSGDVVLIPYAPDRPGGPARDGGPADGAGLTGGERERLAARGVRVADGEAARLVTAPDGRLRGVRLTDGRLIPRAAVFVRPRMVPLDGLLTGLGCVRDGNGLVTTDASGRTGVPGVWAAGNVVNPRAQVITAAGAGSAAAIALNHDLVDEDTALALEAHRAA
ncbi:NAD(P)/FAD-dependent oxidoreductase [Streptomyces sp. CAU 1734]|uniref:NAD(P)/FAD-dependent oxidoreductase n=1 Tax=Streptomyces sp. CAU 1734 TaxID=3140360 RepID=UPI0032613F28